MWLKLALLLVAACAVFAAEPKILYADSTYRVPNEYLVVLKKIQPTVNKEAFISDVVKKIGSISSKLEVANRIVFTKLVILKIHSAEEAKVKALLSLSEVDFIAANENKPYLSQTCVAEDTGSNLWGLSRLTATALPDYNGAQYEYLASDGANAYAYVVDTGIYTENVDFGGRATRGYTAPDLQQREGDDDENGHGTHCAGTVMSNTYGVAKAGNSIAVKVLSRNGMGSTSDIALGLEWVLQDYLAKVALYGNQYLAVGSMSLGGGANDVMDNAVQECLDAGLGFAIAAGNSDDDACGYSPARVPDAMTVGATDSADNLASFSNWGTCVDVLAPGVSILSTWIGSPTATNTISGTSMSTPHVAGVSLRYMSQLGSRPTVSDLTTWVVAEATNDLVNLRGMTSTPNELLHAPCTLTAKTTDQKIYY